VKTSPTQRSLKMMRADGWLCAIVEKYNSFIKVRQDLFGFADILCVKQNEVLLIQTTSGSNVSERIKKIQALQAAEIWLDSPNRSIHVHGWRKAGPRGGVKKWECRVVKLEYA